MPASLPYLASYKNVPALFEKIASARVPDALTTRVLADTFGLKGTNDRAMIGLLKTMGFLDQGGKPTTEYHKLKNPSLAKQATAAGIHRAYEPLFKSNEKANELSAEELKGLISQVAGTDEEMTKRIAGTFNSLAKLADFSGGRPETEEEEEEDEKLNPPLKLPAAEEAHHMPAKRSPEFHYNIQVHLPANGTEETYLNIFTAIRKSFV